MSRSFATIRQLLFLNDPKQRLELATNCYGSCYDNEMGGNVTKAAIWGMLTPLIPLFSLPGFHHSPSLVTLYLMDKNTLGDIFGAA